MDWIYLAQDRDLGFHKMLGSSWVAAQLAASEEGLSSMSERASDDMRQDIWISAIEGRNKYL
jgi:hypothetical protein